MIFPNFFIVGAPKCGTTSLSSWLSSHPGIFISSPKEPFFFDCDIKSLVEFDRKSYLSLFDGASRDCKFVGEGSTTYAVSDVAIDNILDFNPAAKFIFLVRDPVKMAPALHEQEVYSLNETVRSFEEAWSLQEKRMRGECVPSGCVDKKKLMYRDICSLGSQLLRLKSKVPKESLFVGCLEDMKENPESFYLSVLNFLGVENDGRSVFLNENPSKVFRSKFLQKMIILAVRIRSFLGVTRGFGFSNINRVNRVRDELPKHVEEMLINELQSERDILFSLTGFKY